MQKFHPDAGQDERKKHNHTNFSHCTLPEDHSLKPSSKQFGALYNESPEKYINGLNCLDLPAKHFPSKNTRVDT